MKQPPKGSEKGGFLEISVKWSKKRREFDFGFWISDLGIRNVEQLIKRTSNIELPTLNVECGKGNSECAIRKVEHRIGKGELLIPTADIEWKRLTGSEVQASFPFRISLRRSTTFSENHATVVCEYPHVDGRRLRYIQQMPSQDGTLG